MLQICSILTKNNFYLVTATRLCTFVDSYGNT